ncbi:MAG: hypothetical protein P4L73_13345 [Caulobacteraceae bacterium]|nr:hypothetical protein [Caulobacteraceae bacterium]
MDSTFWIAVGGVVGALALGVTLIVHVVTYAYQRGAMDTRVRSLEEHVAKASDTSVAIAALAATVDGLKRSVDKLDAYLDGRVSVLEQRLNGSSAGRKRVSAN